MSVTVRELANLVLKASVGLLLFNEVRGLVMAVPVLYAMYEAGGTMMAIWLGFCSLAGIALSVLVPLLLARKLTVLAR